MNTQRKQQLYNLSLRIGIPAAIATIVIIFLIHKDVTWTEFKDSIQSAPAAAFIATLIILPPIGVPLSVFLLAVGAKFGSTWGSMIACAAIPLHHMIAAGISHLASPQIREGSKQSGWWQKLEQKCGGNGTRLLLLWGLLPGLPYLAKLYLPLAMNVSRREYILWNSLGHVIGAVLFVGLGNAILNGLNGATIAILAGGTAVAITVRVLKARISSKATT